MGGGHWGGGHWAGGSHWSGHSHFAFHGARFHHHRRFIVGFAGYDYGCWRLRPTPWGWRRVWVCGYPYYGLFLTHRPVCVTLRQPPAAVFFISAHVRLSQTD